jgi:hypothetical protein
MFLCDPQHPFSSWKRKISYIVNTSITFLIIAAVAYIRIDALITENAPGVWHDSFIVTALIISPIVLLLDELFYLFIVCPCCINNCRLCHITTSFISLILQYIALLIGLASFLFAVILASRLSQTGLEWMVRQIVMGLLVYPTLEKCLVFLLPFIPIPIGLRCYKNYYFALMGNWYIERNDCISRYNNRSGKIKDNKRGEYKENEEEENYYYIEIIGCGGCGSTLLPI